MKAQTILLTQFWGSDMAERQQIIDQVKKRLVDGSITQEQARKVLQSIPSGTSQAQAEPQVQEQPAASPMPERGMLDAVGGAISGVAEMFTGNQRTGRDLNRLPSLFESDFLSDVSAAQKAKIVGLAQITGDPEELAKVIAEQIPDAQVQYNRDEMGNVYPVLRRQDGRAAAVDKPGMDLLNASQLATDMAMFTPAGRSAGVVGGVAKATATESARQGVQAGTGGDFNALDVALAGGAEGAGRAIESTLGAAFRGSRGEISADAQEVIDAGLQYDVPVLTTDVVPPRTPVGRAGQIMAETVPLIGTGGKRAAQQEARQQATDQFVERFEGGSYDAVISSLKAQRDKVKSAAGGTYDRLGPKLNAASDRPGGIGFTNAEKAIEAASEVLTRPGRKSSDRAVELLGDIQETVTGPGQTFQNVKSNLGAWQAAIESVDPAIRSQLTSEDKSVITNVLRSIRKDRDSFAESVLSPNEYRQLKNADSAYGEMAQTMKQTRIKNVLDKGDMTPEVARNLLFSNKPSEVNQMYKGLTNEGRNNARATIITDIASRLSNRASGLTPDSLATELGKRREVLDVFFRGNRRRELNGFLRLLNATRQAQKSKGTFTAATGQQAIPYIVGAGSALEPSLAAAFGTVGMIGRFYESPKVRGVLARMASVEPGSSGFENLLKQYRQETVRVAQSIKDDEIPENLTDAEPAQ
jgi:hypothetical protein